MCMQIELEKYFAKLVASNIFWLKTPGLIVDSHVSQYFLTDFFKIWPNLKS